MSSSSRLLAVACALVLAFGGCDFVDWLFGSDTTPPECQVTTPGDSSIVSGKVKFHAEASDSWGIERVEFYIDGSLVGTDTVASYGVDWDTDGFDEGSWHELYAVAYDPSSNQGTSDKVHVEVRHGGQRDIFHGTFELPQNYYRWVDFEAGAGDSVIGDCRVASGGTLGRLIVLDSANFDVFKTGGTYNAVHEERNFSEVSVRAGVPSLGDHYLVFLNDASADTVEGWARFVLE